MRRVLHIVASMDPQGGGVAQAISTVALGLREKGFASEVACIDGPNADFVRHNTPFTIHALGPGRFGWSYTGKLKQWLQSEGCKYDFWIVHGLWLYPNFIAVCIGSGQGKPVFLYPHGMLDPWFQSWRRRPWKTFRNVLYWHLLEVHTVRRASGLLFTSEEERRLAAKTFSRYRPQMEKVIGLGNADVPSSDQIPEDAFVRSFPELAGRPYLLFLGRLNPKKGIDLLLQGWAKATSGLTPEALPLLVIAGPEEDPAYGLALRKLADDLLPSGSCLFPGMVSGKAKWAALRGAEAFVLFSHQENFGIAVVESLACETPVMISDKVNIWREIIAKDAGWVSHDSIEPVANCLKAWLEFPIKVRNAARPRAREVFLESFEADEAAHRLAELLEGRSHSA